MLQKGVIVFDISEDVEKDFITMVFLIADSLYDMSLIYTWL